MRWSLPQHLGDHAEEYKIEVTHHDPGTEFQGEFQECLARHNIIDSVGATRRHTHGAVIEGYHGVVQTHAAAMAVTAMGAKAKHLAKLVHGDLYDHATLLRRHRAITAW